MAGKKRKRKKKGASRCVALRKKFLLYLDKAELTVEELRAIDEHTDQCEECWRELHFWKSFLTAYRIKFAADPQTHPPVQAYADYLVKSMGEEYYWSVVVQAILDEEDGLPHRGHA